MSVLFDAGNRFVELIAANSVPPSLLRQAALGELSLPEADRILVLVYLAQGSNAFRDEARRTLAQFPLARASALAAMPECPDWVRSYFAAPDSSIDTPGSALPATTGSDTSDHREIEAEPLEPEHRQLLEEAARESDPFTLVEASDEEREQINAALPRKAESLLIRVAKMTVPERVHHALIGSRDERLLLVRDANKIVQRAVLTSPRLAEADVELIAGMRNVSDEVLRGIGQSRRWRQSMVVVRNLVNNPRTPLEIGLQLTKHLFPNDLRQVSNNKNIHEMVRRMAVKLLSQRVSG